jgi:hypothetical protein
MLNPNVTETGVAVAQAEETGYYYAVQMFGWPSSQRIQFRIRNHSDAVIRYKLGDRTLSLPPRYTRTHQECTTGELTFQWSDGSARSSRQTPKTIQPNDGDRYIISQKGSGEFSVRRE